MFHHPGSLFWYSADSGNSVYKAEVRVSGKCLGPTMEVEHPPKGGSPPREETGTETCVGLSCVDRHPFLRKC